MSSEASTASASVWAVPKVSRTTAIEEIRDRADTVRTGVGRQGTWSLRKASRQKLRGPHGRVAIVSGARTPFSKAGGELRGMSVIDLAGVAGGEAVARAGIDPAEVELAVFGVVVASLEGPNLGREAVFRAGLPAHVPGTAVNLACASANRAIVTGAEAILLGEAEVVLAGGAESLSNVPLRFAGEAAERFTALSRAKSLGQKARLLSGFRPRHFVPIPPAIAELVTGLTMGQSCEKMAKENAVGRRAQDEIALLSHQRAAAARAAGKFAEEIVPVFPPPRYDRVVTSDNGIRDDASLEALSRLPPVFDRRFGTLTAGNSSPITDGGAAVLLMSERKARALGLQPLGYLRSYAWAAIPPDGQLLQGPAYAVPLALERAGLSLAEIDLVEMHEAFAAQVLSNLKAFASRRFAREELGRSEPVGEVDLERWNVNGGSIALGHPFGATGARITLQLLKELGRRGGQFGLVSVCAAGGHGFAAVLERE